MSLQARLSQSDPRLYDPNRDIAHNFEFVVKKAADFLEDRQWPALHEWLDSQGVTLDDLGHACQAYILYVSTTAQYKSETLAQGLQRSGWDQVPEAAKIAHQAYIGLIMTGMWYHAARASSIGGGSNMDAVALVEEGSRIARRMTGPWWKWKLRRLVAAVKKFVSQCRKSNPKN